MFVLSISVWLTACSTSQASILPDTPAFKKGQSDGCMTAKGEYIKDSDAFNSNEDYKKGWFYGRKICNPSHAK